MTILINKPLRHPELYLFFVIAVVEVDDKSLAVGEESESVGKASDTPGPIGILLEVTTVYGLPSAVFVLVVDDVHVGFELVGVVAEVVGVPG